MKNFNKAVNVHIMENGPGLITDMEVAGQVGYGLKAGALDGATPLVLPPAVIYVTQTPHMWDLSIGGVVLARVVKAMFETHAKSVSGIDIGYTLESGQQPVGHDGQQMDAPTVSKRAPVNPSFTYGEVTGNLVFRVHQTWIWDMADPDTQISLARIPEAELLPFTMSTYALSFMALQFDQTYAANRLLGATYITNVYPQGTGDFGLKREIGQANVQDRTITYTGLAIENEYIYDLGRTIAHDIGFRHRNEFHNPTDPYSFYSNDHGRAAMGINTTSGEFDTGIRGDSLVFGPCDRVGDEFEGKSPVGDGSGEEV